MVKVKEKMSRKSIFICVAFVFLISCPDNWPCFSLCKFPVGIATGKMIKKIVFFHSFSLYSDAVYVIQSGGGKQSAKSDKQTAEENDTRGAFRWTEEWLNHAKTTKRQTDGKITNRHQKKPSWKEEEKITEQRMEGWKDTVGKRSS